MPTLTDLISAPMCTLQGVSSPYGPMIATKGFSMSASVSPMPCMNARCGARVRPFLMTSDRRALRFTISLLPSTNQRTRLTRQTANYSLNLPFSPRRFRDFHQFTPLERRETCPTNAVRDSNDESGETHHDPNDSSTLPAQLLVRRRDEG